MGNVVVLYEPTVSAMVEASRVGGRSVVYAHLSGDSLKLVGRGADAVVLVVERVTTFISKALATLDKRAKLVVAKKRWYAEYAFKHLIEPRMKDVLTKQSADEYSLVLSAEYRTIELCRRTLATITPRKVGDFTFAVVPRVPTGDVATLYYEKYRTPVLVASVRDAGVAWSAIAERDTLRELANRLSKVGYVDSEPNAILSGFILTYPESPRAYLPVIEEVLQAVPAKPPASVTLSKTCDAVKTATTFYDYLRFKARHVSQSSSKTSINGETYAVVYCGQSSPYYVSFASNGSCTVMFYLPPPSKLALATPFIPGEIRTSKLDVKVSPVASTPDSKYISVVPSDVVREIRGMLRRCGRAALSVVACTL